MTKKIFRSILLTSLAVLLISLSIAVGCLYYYFGNVQEQQLDCELTLAAGAVEESGIGYLERLETDDLRLTLVDADGAVLYDTNVDAAAMENHADREEIREAFASGKGESSRYSSTLTEKTIYHAALLDDGTCTACFCQSGNGAYADRRNYTVVCPCGIACGSSVMAFGKAPVRTHYYAAESGGLGASSGE